MESKLSRAGLRLGAAACTLAVLAGRGPAQASFTTFGTACQGATLQRPALWGDAPIPGFVFGLQVGGLSPSTAGTLLIGLRDDQMGSSPLPLDLSSLGAADCRLYVNADPAAGAMAVPLVSSGVGAIGGVRWTFPIPDLPGVQGFRFFTQYLSLEAPAWRALPITTTNAARAEIGAFGLPDLVPIPPGSFSMGSTQGGAAEQPVHTVQITRPFWIGRYEVRQAEWDAVMGFNASYFRGPDRPVEVVSWHQAEAYCAILSARERAAGRLPSGYCIRLPTEAEWEYCCRAGSTSEWNVGAGLDCAQANIRLADGRHCVGATTVVGSHPPNAFGLHDMHGNVWEWCADSWDGSANYPTGPVADPCVRSGELRILRGGSWARGASEARSAHRAGLGPNEPWGFYGFRIVVAPELAP
jgi:formylglycine-generating enzyme required for sulfatase activity